MKTEIILCIYLFGHECQVSFRNFLFLLRTHGFAQQLFGDYLKYPDLPT